MLGGDSADTLVVSARTDDGVGLFLVDGNDVARAPYTMQDGLRGADILLTDAPGHAARHEHRRHSPTIDTVIDRATAALCAEAVGAMARMLTMTVDYLKTRVQFGQPIAVFQALQFRSADMYVSLEQARSMTLLARLALAGDDPAERRRLVQAAKIQIDLAGRHISQEAIQLHGGIGMTMEYPVGHYAKRVTVISKTFADLDHLIAQVGDGEGLVHA